MNLNLEPTVHEKIARNVSLISTSVVLTMLIGLLLKTLLPRILGPEKMGVFYFCESFSMMFFVFLPLGLTTYIDRTIPSDHGHTREIFTTIFCIEWLMALILGSAMLLFLLASGRSEETLYCALAMGVYAAIFHFQRNIMQKIFLATEQVRLIAIVNVVVKIILVAGCLLLLNQKASVVSVAIMHVIAETCGFIYLLSVAFKQQFFHSKPSLGLLRKILRISLPFYFSAVLIGVFGEVDTFMLGQMSSDIEVGYFGAAYKLIGVMLLLVPILQSSLTPALSQAFHRQDGSLLPLVRQLMRFLLLACLPLTIFLLLFGDYFARLLYGPGFEPSYKIVCFLAPVLVMMYLNTFVSITLHLSSSGSKISKIFIIGLAMNIGLDYLAIPIGQKFGPGGAGLAVSFCTFMCEVYTYLALLNLFPGQIFDRQLGKNLLLILLPCFVAMAFYEPLMSLSFAQRFALSLLTPVYALSTASVSRQELKQSLTWLAQRFRHR